MILSVNLATGALWLAMAFELLGWRSLHMKGLLTLSHKA
jgi:hypothetical protein